MAGISEERTNSEWVNELSKDGSQEQEQAFRDLGSLLFRRVCTYIALRAGTLPSLRDLHRQEQEARAQGIVQEALLTIYQQLSAYREEGSFLGWATTIARNLARRRLGKADEQTERFPQNEETRIASLPDLKSLTPEQQTKVNEILALIEWIVQNNLSDRQRRAFAYRFINGYNNEEIAELLEITSNAVYGLIFQARTKIKRCLQEEGYDLEEYVSN